MVGDALAELSEASIGQALTFTAWGERGGDIDQEDVLYSADVSGISLKFEKKNTWKKPQVLAFLD